MLLTRPGAACRYNGTGRGVTATCKVCLPEQGSWIPDRGYGDEQRSRRFGQSGRDGLHEHLHGQFVDEPIIALAGVEIAASGENQDALAFLHGGDGPASSRDFTVPNRSPGGSDGCGTAAQIGGRVG